jgi:hypothetical protein
MMRVAGKFQDIRLSDPDMFYQLPDTIRQMGGNGTQQIVVNIPDGIFERGMGAPPIQPLFQVSCHLGAVIFYGR